MGVVAQAVAEVVGAVAGVVGAVVEVARAVAEVVGVAVEVVGAPAHARERLTSRHELHRDGDWAGTAIGNEIVPQPAD